MLNDRIKERDESAQHGENMKRENARLKLVIDAMKEYKKRTGRTTRASGTDQRGRNFVSLKKYSETSRDIKFTLLDYNGRKQCFSNGFVLFRRRLFTLDTLFSPPKPDKANTSSIFGRKRYHYSTTIQSVTL